MKGYILSIIGVCVVGTLISVVSPNGEGGGLGKHIRLIIAICVIGVCINPINEVINYINEVNVEDLVGSDDKSETDYEEIFKEHYSAAEIYNLKVGIRQLLCDRFDVDGAECSISVRLSEDGKLSGIFITLYGSAVFKDTGEIEKYFADLFDCEIVTAIG